MKATTYYITLSAATTLMAEAAEEMARQANFKDRWDDPDFPEYTQQKFEEAQNKFNAYHKKFVEAYNQVDLED